MAGAKLIQVVKAHVPLIKFHHSPKVLSNVLDQGASPDAVSPLDRPIVPSAKSAPTTSKPIGSSLRGSGIDFKDLPKRYQRKPLDQHEIDVITRGGPE